MSKHITIGMDLGDRNHIVVVLDPDGQELGCFELINKKVSLKRFFERYFGATVAIEAGTHSPWISRLLEQMGFQVYVGNPRKLRMIWDSTDKSDERDARMLAMVCRLEPKLLWPIRHRGMKSHSDLEISKARNMLVQTRTKLINHVRSVVKGVGERLPSCSAASFCRRVVDFLPEELLCALMPLIDTISDVTGRIRQIDKRINELTLERYPEAQTL